MNSWITNHVLTTKWYESKCKACIMDNNQYSEGMHTSSRPQEVPATTSEMSFDKNLLNSIVFLCWLIWRILQKLWINHVGLLKVLRAVRLPFFVHPIFFLGFPNLWVLDPKTILVWTSSWIIFANFEVFDFLLFILS